MFLFMSPLQNKTYPLKSLIVAMHAFDSAFQTRYSSDTNTVMQSDPSAEFVSDHRLAEGIFRRRRLNTKFGGECG